jgi:hypothetical protein
MLQIGQQQFAQKSKPYKEKHSGKQPIPERYHYFEWSD